MSHIELFWLYEDFALEEGRTKLSECEWLIVLLFPIIVIQTLRIRLTFFESYTNETKLPKSILFTDVRNFKVKEIELFEIADFITRPPEFWSSETSKSQKMRKLKTISLLVFIRPNCVMENNQRLKSKTC
jgi:hypothetical protein